MLSPSLMETLATFLIIYLLGMLSSLALTRLIQRAYDIPPYRAGRRFATTV